MKARDYTGWVLMLAAAGFGVAAFFLVRQYLAAEQLRLREEAQAAQGRMLRVVVATQDLDAGTLVDGHSMSVGELPARHVSDRAVRPEAFPRVENRVLGRPMSAGEPLLEDFISGAQVARFSDLLAPGTRAISLEVSALESHAGLLLPGDYIDLFVLMPAEDGRRDRRLLGLIERVKVLAAGEQPLRSAEQPYQPLEPQGGGYSLITLGLPWADAERMLRARRVGEVVYLLRPAADTQMRFASTGVARFGDSPVVAGYTYYSGAVPQGQRRPLREADASAASADPYAAIDVSFGTDRDAGPEADAESGSESGSGFDSVTGAGSGFDDAPLPLEILFTQVPKTAPRSPPAPGSGAMSSTPGLEGTP